MKSCFTVALLLLSFAAPAAPLVPGAGEFTLPGGEGRVEKAITVYFHVPANASPDSPVVIVVPGAGRNGWSYRDAWVDAAERHGVIVVSPSYSEEHYPEFWNYNLARMLTDVKINAARTDFESYSIVEDPREWIFADFDRLFDAVTHRFGLTAERYDMFGHSAGGQILHRYALFHDSAKVDRLLASNSGWYTVPSHDAAFPTGLAEAPIKPAMLEKAFARKLVVFLGERDDENETRGHLVRNPRMDRQGLHRLARGGYFYEVAKKQAEARGAPFRWEKVVIPGVGHDYRKMSEAAADYPVSYTHLTLPTIYSV